MLKDYNSFIPWAVSKRPNSDRDDKIPINYRSGRPCDAHAPENHLSYDECKRYCEATPGLHMGFVFSSRDPYFFVDIDECKTPSGDNDFAQYLLTYFSGAFVERSHSGRGYHIIGRIDHIDGLPACVTLLDADETKIFIKNRFCALTYNDTHGDEDLNYTEHLQKLWLDYSKNAQQPNTHDWTVDPVAEYTGPDDDDALISVMLGATTKFPTAVPLAALWQADEKTLSQQLPPTTGPGPWDRSKADAKLLSHLAFWTGKNCERMERLYKMSGLGQHPNCKAGRANYLESSITKACAVSASVYSKKKKAEPPAHSDPSENGGTSYAIKTLLDQERIFEGCIYVRQLNKILAPDGHFYGESQFKNYCGGGSYMLDAANTAKAKSAWEAFVAPIAMRWPWAHDVGYDPVREFMEVYIDDENSRLVNTYRRPTEPAIPGDVALFVEHVSRLIPERQDYDTFIAWMAALVQYPDSKFRWAPMIVGGHGNGKGRILQCLKYCVGRRNYWSPKPRALAEGGGKFNAWAVNRVFVCITEVEPAHAKNVYEALKQPVGDEDLEIEDKGITQTMSLTYTKMMLNSNHVESAEPFMRDRRFAIYICPQKTEEDSLAQGMDGAYFKRLSTWLEAGGYAHVAHFLRTYPIPDALNPAIDRGHPGLSNVAPKTVSSRNLRVSKFGELAELINECIEEERPGFRGGFVSSKALKRVLDERYPKGQAPRNMAIAQALSSLDYVRHPTLAGGRLTRKSTVAVDESTRAVLYVHVRHHSTQLNGTAEVQDAYQNAQSESEAITPARQVFPPLKQ